MTAARSRPPAEEQHAGAIVYEAVIKVRVDDPPERRCRDIKDGIGYACALLMDEYGQSADEIESVLERVIDDMHDNEASR